MHPHAHTYTTILISIFEVCLSWLMVPQNVWTVLAWYFKVLLA